MNYGFAVRNTKTGNVGLVLDYFRNGDNYLVWYHNGPGRNVIARKDCTLYDGAPKDEELAGLLREASVTQDIGQLVLDENGWNIISYIDREEERPYGREDYHVDQDPGAQEIMVWDPASKTMVPGFASDAEQTRSRPDNWGFDDTMRFKPKNPEMEGIYANDVETDPFFKRDPKPDLNHDDSFPSMNLTRIRPVKSGMKNFTHVDEERHYESNNPPNLDECPECGDPMIDNQEHTASQCHACGHKQPIIYNESKNKNAGKWQQGPQDYGWPGDHQNDPLDHPGEDDNDSALHHAVIIDNGDHRMMLHNNSDEIKHDRRSLDEIRDDLSRQGLNQTGSFGDSTETWSRTSAHGDDNKDVGIAVDIKGTDVVPDAGNQGFTQDVGDSPEILKDVNGVGGTQGVHHLLEELLGSDHPELEAIRKEWSDLENRHKSSKWFKEAARRPKMCPFHTDLVDYSLALGNPETALRSLGTLMYSPSSCKGGHELLNKNGKPTKCRFKPEMVTPVYWEQKEAEDEARQQEREEREQAQQLLEQPQIQQEIPLEIQQPQEAPVAEVTQPDENTTVVPAEAINQLQQEGEVEIPPVDAIELPTDYDPEAYWEDSDDQQRAEFEQQQPAPVAPIPQAVSPQAPAATPFALAARKLADSMGGPTMMPDPPQLTEGQSHGPMDTLDVADEPKPDSSHVTDESGRPLVAGAVYDMFNSSVDQLPEKIHITKVEPYFIEFEVQNDEFGFGFKNRISTQDIATQQIKFQPHDGSPNADGKPAEDAGAEQNNDDNTHAYDGQGTDDLSTGRSAGLDPKLAWLMEDVETDEMIRTAGKNFALHEQRDLINEPGDARNLDKLDLSGTHYPDTLGEADDELLFF